MEKAKKFTGGGELTAKRIDENYQRELRNYDRNVVQEILNSNYIDVLIKQFFESKDAFIEFLSEFQPCYEYPTTGGEF